MPVVAGEDIGESFALTATAAGLDGYQGFNIVGPSVPTVREVINFLNEAYQLPRPHFGVPFAIAYPFARTMELLDPVVPWDSLVICSIIHLLEETGASNARVAERLGYQPKVHWKDAIRVQMDEMATRRKTAMKMYKPITS